MPLIQSFKDTRVNNYANSHVLTVKIPLQKDEETSLGFSFTSGTNTTPTVRNSEDDYYTKKIAAEGGTLLRSSLSNGAIPRSIAWRILENSTVLELDPLDLNLKQNHQLRKIRFQIPAEILKNCITVSEDSSSENIVIDFLSKTSHVYTIYFSPSEFLENIKQSMSDIGHSLTEENAYKWRKVQYPYHFDFNRSQLLYNVSVNVLVVSTLDGSLVKLTRRSPLDDMMSEVFNDPNKKSGLSYYFSWSHSETVPGWGNLSYRAAVAMISIPTINAIAVLTINRMIQIWSLNSLSLLGEHELKSPKDLPERERIFIGPTPMKLLAIPAFKKSYEKSGYIYLGVYMPLGDGIFKIFKLHLKSQRPILEKLGNEFELIPKVPDSYSTWVVNGFTIFDNTETTPEFQISIMWKSNTSSAFYQATLPNNSQKEVNWFVDCSTRDSSGTLTSNIYHSNQVEYYVEKIFGFVTYSKNVVETALEVYEGHYAFSSFPEPKSPSLKDRAEAIIGATVNVTEDLRQSSPEYQKLQKELVKQWNKFDVLCEELQRSANEVLSTDWDPVLELFWISRAGHSSIIRPALPLELAYANRTNDPSNIVSTIVIGTLRPLKPTEAIDILVLLESFCNLRSNLSPNHVNEIYNALRTEYFSSICDHSTRLTELYNKYLSRHVSKSSLYVLEESLSKVEDLYTELLMLYVLINPRSKNQGRDVSLTTTGGLFVSQVFYSYILLSRSIILDILIAIIATIPSKTVVIKNNIKIYVKFIELLRSFDSISEFFKIDIKDDVEHENSQNPVTEFFVSSSFEQLTTFEQLTIQYPFSNLIDVKGLKPVIFQILGQWKLSTDNEFITPYKFIVELIRQGSLATAQKLARYFPSDNAFSQFINANIELRAQDGDKTKKYFGLAALGLDKENLSAEKLELVSLLSPKSLFTNKSFGNGKAKFLLAASKASLEYNLNDTALALAKEAQASLEADKPDIDVYDHMFNIAIKLSQFKDAKIAVAEIEKLDNQKLKEFSKDEQLVASQQRSLVTPYLETLAGWLVRAGNLSVLENLDLSKSATRTVTEFLFKQAEISLTRALLGKGNKDNSKEETNPFLYYNVLYSWNIHYEDFRGGKTSSTFFYCLTNTFFFPI
jgi:hypothetical protein